jgi:hypothetical protein
MTHCHFSVHYGNPNFVSITSQSSTPIKRSVNKNAKDASSLTLTAVGHTDAQRLQMKKFAQAWTKASTAEEFARHMTEFQSMIKGKWKAFAQPVPASSLAYHFVLEPLQEKAPKRTIGFRRLNDERAFDKTKPAASVARDPDRATNPVKS